MHASAAVVLKARQRWQPGRVAETLHRLTRPAAGAGRTWFRSVLITGGTNSEVGSVRAIVPARTICDWWPSATVSETDTRRTMCRPTSSTAISATASTCATAAGQRCAPGESRRGSAQDMQHTRGAREYLNQATLFNITKPT